MERVLIVRVPPRRERSGGKGWDAGGARASGWILAEVVVGREGEVKWCLRTLIGLRRWVLARADVGTAPREGTSRC